MPLVPLEPLIQRGAEWIYTTADIRTAVVAIADEEENGLTPEALSTDRVGRVLGRMRFRKKPRPGRKGKRQWIIPLTDLQGWAKAYGISFRDI
jgi:hypothetical protein